MGNFKRDSKKSGGGFNRGFGGGGKRFNGRDGGNPTRHKAICGECGASCEVPFRPTGERPVFCSNCFKKQGNDGGRPNKFSDNRRERSNFGDRQRHNVVCAKCGKDCQVPFKPTAGKSVFCDDCFKKDGGRSGSGGGSGSGSGNKNSGEIIGQIKLLNAKMDKLMEMLAPKFPAEKTEKTGDAEIKKEATEKKTVKEKKVKTKTKSAKKKVSAKKKK